MQLSLIFFGADQYSAVALSAILEHHNTGILENITIVTDRGKPKGKNQLVQPSPVELLARQHNLKVFYYPDFDHSLITGDTLGLCASFDHLIPKEIISLFAGHLYNLHPSLLPQYRNVSPVQYAIALGDKVTGITLFRIAPTIDDGEIIAQARENILADDTPTTLTPRLFKLGAELFLNYLNDSRKLDKLDGLDELKTRPLIFTHRLTRDSGFIEWSVLQNLIKNTRVKPSQSNNELLNLRLTHNPDGNILTDLIRALTPWPTVWSLVPSKKGELRISLVPVDIQYSQFSVLISGKPKAISYKDFEKYYL